MCDYIYIYIYISSRSGLARGGNTTGNSITFSNSRISHFHPFRLTARVRFTGFYFTLSPSSPRLFTRGQHRATFSSSGYHRNGNAPIIPERIIPGGCCTHAGGRSFGRQTGSPSLKIQLPANTRGRGAAAQKVSARLVLPRE